MKQLVTIILAAFYFMVSSGLTIDMHFCDGKLVEVTFFDAEQNCCCASSVCDNDAIADCCGDETLLLQVDQWQIVSSIPAYETSAMLYVSMQDWDEKVLEVETEQVSYDSNKSPPPQTDLWLLYQNLTYYG